MQPNLYKILIVDDEPNFLNILSLYLKNEGYEVDCANNAAKALEVLQKEKIHVILSDQKMPGMEGSEFLAMVKNKYPETVRVLITGYSDLKAVIEAVNEGNIYRYISKTLLPEEIALVVKQCAEKYSTDEEILKLSKANKSLLRQLSAERILSMSGVFSREIYNRLEEITTGLSGFLFEEAGQNNAETLSQKMIYLENTFTEMREFSTFTSQTEASHYKTSEDLTGILDEELKKLEEAAKIAGLKIKTEIKKEAALMVSGNRYFITRILKEVLENAVLFSPKENILITIEIEKRKAKPDPHILLKIRNYCADTKGNSTLPFFAPFYTTLGHKENIMGPPLSPDEYNLKNTGHFGLGLPMAQWLACKMGGEIELEKKENSLTTRIFLPLS